MATCGYKYSMQMISIKDAKNRLTELAKQVEHGQVITITRHGKPIVDIVPHVAKAGLNIKAGQQYLLDQGIKQPIAFIDDHFDEPLPDDFLLKPLTSTQSNS